MCLVFVKQLIIISKTPIIGNNYQKFVTDTNPDAILFFGLKSKITRGTPNTPKCKTVNLGTPLSGLSFLF